jgi:hydroxymethylglutaryl-CoA reductase (NADPH)
MSRTNRPRRQPLADAPEGATRRGRIGREGFLFDAAGGPDYWNAMSDACAAVPMRWVGPIRFAGPEVEGEIEIPLATYESPLWPSVARGARATAAAGGLRAVVIDDRMARSILLEAPDAVTAARVLSSVLGRRDDVAGAVAATSSHASLLDLHGQVCGNLLFLRIEIATGDAAGHNMATKAADAVMGRLLADHPALRHVSVSGNYCCDKKVSAVNGILGRGKNVVADVVLPADACGRFLRATPAAIAALNVRKNLVGSILAGSVRSANAHHANMLLAFYLATGQDAANIVEGSQGVTHAEAREEGLYFSVTLPNLVVGTVGSGKDLPFVRENLRRLGVLEPRAPGANARRLAILAAGAVLCGELSLLAAQTNPGELMRAHLKLERRAPPRTR